MIKYFLKAKHWHLFGIFCIIQTSNIVNFLFIFQRNNISHENMDIYEISNVFNFFSLTEMLSTFVLMAWIWSVCVGLNKYLPKNNTLKLNRFKLLFFFTLIYDVIDLTLFDNVMNPISISEFTSFIDIFQNSYWINFIFELISFYSFIYMIYFSAKTIKTIELKDDLKFGRFKLTFLLIAFIPLGIWFLQPRINRIVRWDN